MNPFPLNAAAGPWMICAVTYIGPDGDSLSRQVAEQLSSKHNLAVYIFNRGEEDRRKQQEEWEAQQKRSPGVPVRRRGYRIQDQYAVLVGNFPDFTQASAFLPNLKALPVPELKLEGGKPAYETTIYQEPDPEKKDPVVKRVYMHPFHNAMVVRNPLTSGGTSDRPKWDPFWEQLNRDESYSLLKNRKAWTLVVKVYTGARMLQTQKSKESSFLQLLGLGSDGGTLDAAGHQAHELARLLHEQFKFETWVLHTRQSSVVCVGGFDSDKDPALQRTQQQISTLKFTSQKGGADPIGLMPNPVPVEVPRP